MSGVGRGRRAAGAAIAAFATLGLLSGCAYDGARASRDLQLGALYGQFAAFDGEGRRLADFDSVVAAARRADVILFGEEHNDVVCNQLEAELLTRLVRRGVRPALAMEFIENDAQPAVEAYLAGRNRDEAAFVEAAGQGKKYAVSHRPLIEICRARHLPVIAANAPRELVSGFRKSGLPFDAYRAQLPLEQRQLLPAELPEITGGYRERFMALMAHGAGHGEDFDPEALFRAQTLWDAAMAGAIAEAREEHPRQPVLLIVGRFHVADDGGLKQILRMRRPDDRILTIVYAGGDGGARELPEDERGAGDVVLSGIRPRDEVHARDGKWSKNGAISGGQRSARGPNATERAPMRRPYLTSKQLATLFQHELIERDVVPAVEFAADFVKDAGRAVAERFV